MRQIGKGLGITWSGGHFNELVDHDDVGRLATPWAEI